MIKVGITEAPSAPITVTVFARGTGETASADDYTFTQTSLTFATNGNTDANLRQSISIAVHSDTNAETDKTIVLTLADDSANSRTAEGSGFSLGSPHTITIPTNDNTVGFASNAVTTLGENGGTAGAVANVSQPAPVAITLNVATGGEADAGNFIINSLSLRIEAGQPTGTIMLASVNNDVGESHQTINLTLSASGTLPNNWTLGDAEHAVDILDDDLFVGFVRASDTVGKPSIDADHTIDIDITDAPSANITLEIQAVSGSTANVSADVSFTRQL